MDSVFARPGGVDVDRLPCGLTVCRARNPQAPIVATALVYRAGARDEAPGMGGLAHFLEHMMFKGSSRYGRGEIDRITQRLGGNNNAFTSHDATAYYFSFASDRWREALAIESDRMAGLELDPDELESERRVILEEIAMYDDDPWDSLEMEVQKTLYGGHPYGHPVLGSRQEVSTLSRDDFAAFHRRFYRPANAVLAIAGDLDDSALEAAESAFAGLERAAPERDALPAPAPASGARRVERRQGEVPRLLVALPGPPAASDESALLRLVATVLAAGRASRLFRSLVDERSLCLDVSASVAENVAAGHTAIAMELLPEVGIEEVEARLGEELARLRTDPVGEEELARAKRVFAADWVFQLERIHQQAITSALALALFDADYPERILRRVLAAEPGELREIAARYLDPERGGVVGVARVA